MNHFKRRRTLRMFEAKTLDPLLQSNSSDIVSYQEIPGQPTLRVVCGHCWKILSEPVALKCKDLGARLVDESIELVERNSCDRHRCECTDRGHLTVNFLRIRSFENSCLFRFLAKPSRASREQSLTSAAAAKFSSNQTRASTCARAVSRTFIRRQGSSGEAGEEVEADAEESGFVEGRADMRHLCCKSSLFARALRSRGALMHCAGLLLLKERFGASPQDKNAVLDAKGGRGRGRGREALVGRTGGGECFWSKSWCLLCTASGASWKHLARIHVNWSPRCVDCGLWLCVRRNYLKGQHCHLILEKKTVFREIKQKFLISIWNKLSFRMDSSSWTGWVTEEVFLMTNWLKDW